MLRWTLRSMLPVRTSTSAPKGVFQRFSVARGAAASKSWRVVEELLDTGEKDLAESTGCAISSPSRDSFSDIDASAVGILSGDHGD